MIASSQENEKPASLPEEISQVRKKTSLLEIALDLVGFACIGAGGKGGGIFGRRLESVAILSPVLPGSDCEGEDQSHQGYSRSSVLERRRHNVVLHIACSEALIPSVTFSVLY
jgi:hypothetical protein